MSMRTIGTTLGFVAAIAAACGNDDAARNGVVLFEKITTK
jgi:hypothetical protein